MNRFLLLTHPKAYLRILSLYKFTPCVYWGCNIIYRVYSTNAIALYNYYHALFWEPNHKNRRFVRGCQLGLLKHGSDITSPGQFKKQFRKSAFISVPLTCLFHFHDNFKMHFRWVNPRAVFRGHFAGKPSSGLNSTACVEIYVNKYYGWFEWFIHQNALNLGGEPRIFWF